MLFEDRAQAGRVLAGLLQGYAGRPDALVLGLPRGGVVVALAVAEALNLPLDVFVVRKLGAPGMPEFAFGAIASGGVRFINEDVVAALCLRSEDVEDIAARQSQELLRREAAYRASRPALPLPGKVVIVVDDGLATGASMTAAVRAIKKARARQVVVAVPLGTPSVCQALRREADKVVCSEQPYPFEAVGLWYRDFQQTSDKEVRALLERSLQKTGVSP